MDKRKIKWKRWGLMVMLAAPLVYALWFITSVLPVISAYGAKYCCDAVYLQHRNIDEVVKQDLSDFPFNLGSYTLNQNDSSVTGTVWGRASRKAIYRINAGSTLVNDISEAVIRSQTFLKPTLPPLDLDTVPWPRGERITSGLTANIDTTRLQQFLRECLNENFNDKPSHTRAVVVVYDGHLVGEAYAPGYNSKTVMPAWSITKSITGALIGILHKERKLDIDQPAPIREWEQTDKRKITIRHLLQQTSGLYYDEDYYGPNGPNEMLFKRGSAAEYAINLPVRKPPGEAFIYSSANSNILSAIIKNTVAEKYYTAFPYDALLYKTGMYSTQLEPDASGMYVGSSFCFATARDYARLGLLYYNNGNWLGEQILPEDWVQQATTAPEGNSLKTYGFQLWLNGYADSTRTTRVYPSAPADMYYASGYNDQNIFIIPSRKLVLVRLGLNKLDEDHFIRRVLECLPL